MDPKKISLRSVENVFLTLVVGKHLVPHIARRLTAEDVSSQAPKAKGQKVLDNLKRVSISRLLEDLQIEGFLLADVFYEEQQRIVLTLVMVKGADTWYSIRDLGRLLSATVGYADAYLNPNNSIGLSLKAVQPGMKPVNALRAVGGYVVAHPIHQSQTGVAV